LGESYGLWAALRALHRAHGFDVVEFTNWEGLGAVASALGGVPTVIRLHTSAFDSLRLGLGIPRVERQFARLERWTANRAAALVTHSESHRRQVATDYRVPADRIRVIPHGVRPVRATAPRPRNPAQVLAVSAATPRKGVETFLRAADRLSREFPAARFVWAGKDTPTAPGGRTWAEYREAEWPQLGNVTFTGACSDADLADLYAESGVYLCTSLYESFGLTLVEAMHAGVPVVAPRTAAMPEVVRDGETGYLYEPDDFEGLARSVASLLRSPGAAAELGRNGQRRAAEEYSVDRMSERVLEVYRRVC
jgi:glycosyltransferase involved in cell wall biosynthesis